MRLAGLTCVVVLTITISCTTKEQSQELLVQQYCGSCHATPEPSLLSKDAWRTVLPQMAVRMGVSIAPLTRLNEQEYGYVIETLPKTPMISNEDFQAIMAYYEREAPDSLALPKDFEAKELKQFSVTSIKSRTGRPATCMLQADTVHKQIWTANRHNVMYKYSYDFKILDSVKVAGPASSAITDETSPLLALMGIMDPNDQPKGSVLDLKTGKTLIDSIKRPVQIVRADLNNDKKDDIVVCAFGNYGGELAVYENSDGQYIKHSISGLPGARKAVVRDFNNDGMNDVLVMFSQGDENISLYTNAGNFRFRVTTLLRFPPVYGSEYFDIVDFNKDGNWDLVYINGDNNDYSKIFKPYHGVRVYLNDGQNHFKESFFQQLYGGSMAIARDFDNDGDVDIAAVAFFPDFARTPERGFVYLENNNGKMEPYTTKMGMDGRWLLMESVDLDSDGYLDLVLSALNFEDGITTGIGYRWKDNPVDFLVLKNKGKN